MAWAFRTLIVPTAQAQTARDVAAALSPAGVNMWTTPLSADGLDPATHYVSTGLIGPEFAAMVPEQVWELQDGQWVMVSSTPGDPVMCYQACLAAGLSITQAEIDAVYAVADVTEQEPFVAFDRLGLQIINPQIT